MPGIDPPDRVLLVEAIGARDLRVDGALGSTFAAWLRSLFA
jgi:hypothetical protein